MPENEPVTPLRWQEYPLPGLPAARWQLMPDGLQPPRAGDLLVVCVAVALPTDPTVGAHLNSIILAELRFEQRLLLVGEGLSANWGHADGPGWRCRSWEVLGKTWSEALAKAEQEALKELGRLRALLQFRAEAMKSDGWEIVETARALEDKT